MSKPNADGRSNERSEFERLLEEEFSPSHKNCSANEIITGIPVKITREGAFISIPGKKSESFIPANELPSLIPLVENEAAEFQVVGEESEDGQFKLSYSWTAAAKLQQEGKTVEIVVKHLKERKFYDNESQGSRSRFKYDGAEVVIPALGNLQAFAPSSQLGDVDLEQLKGKKLQAKITEVAIVPAQGKRQEKRRLIVSPLAQTKEEHLSFLQGLQKGQTVTARVRRVEPTYAVVYFPNGVSALIFSSEIAIFGEQEDLSAAKAEGKELEFEVTNVDLRDKDKPSLKLSRRAILVRTRKEELQSTLRIGDIVSARVTNISKDGRSAFLLVEECLPAFLGAHKLAVYTQDVNEVLSPNQVIRARFIAVHEKTGNLTLSMKGVQQ
ncbi:MAG: hypothetical protein K2X29_04900 [Candidatus Obscuribacterales bacterium]|nr:hypothetical protein [Candidatus Obscuribacterales bacterium]